MNFKELVQKIKSRLFKKKVSDADQDIELSNPDNTLQNKSLHDLIQSGQLKDLVNKQELNIEDDQEEEFVLKEIKSDGLKIGVSKPISVKEDQAPKNLFDEGKIDPLIGTKLHQDKKEKSKPTGSKLKIPDELKVHLGNVDEVDLNQIEDEEEEHFNIATEMPKAQQNSTFSDFSKEDKTGEFRINHEHKRSFFDLLKDNVNELKSKINFNKQKDGIHLSSPSTQQGYGPNLQLGHYFRTIFASRNRPLTHRIFIILIISILTFQTGKMISTFVSIPSKVAKKKKIDNPVLFTAPAEEFVDTSTIVSNNLFKAKMNANEANKEKKISIEDLICDNSNSNNRTSLPIKLVQTTVLQDSVKSIASIQVRGAELEHVREGEKIKGIAEITHIGRLKILIKNIEQIKCEYVASDDLLDKGSSNFSILDPANGKRLMDQNRRTDVISKGNKIIIKKAFRDEQLKDMAKLLSDARAIKITQADGSLAFKIVEIAPGSVYSMLNIQDGDMISEINGRKLKDLNEVMNMFGKIKSVDKLDIALLRDGMPKKMEYVFE